MAVMISNGQRHPNTRKKRSERTKKLKGKKGFLQNLSLITGLAREKVKERKRKVR